jgi:predicted nucleotidyltransferase component of viral defense system
MKYTDEFEKMNDDLADQLAQQVLSIEQQRNALKKTYYDRVKQGLGGIVAMRFLQVENQLERLVDLQIAASLPVIDAR